MSYYNRNRYSRYNRTNLSGTGGGSDEASERQVAFLLSLWEDAYAAANDEAFAATVVAAVTPVAEDVALVKAGQAISKRRASEVIDTLKGLSTTLKGLKVAASFPGLVGYDHTMTTKRAGNCVTCGATTITGVDFAGVKDGKWFAICTACATTSPEVRAQQIAAEVAQRAAEREAGRKAADEAMAKAAELRQVTGLLRARIKLTTGSLTRDQAIRVVLPGTVVGVDNSEAAYRVSIDTRRTGVERHTGGVKQIAHHKVGVDKAIEIVNLLLALDGAALVEAQAAYGRHFHQCGRCGSPLSDDRSKAMGLGPDCALKG